MNKIKELLSAANRWRKSKGMTLALAVIILSAVQPYVESLNSATLTMIIGVTIGVVRFYTTTSLSDK